MFGNILPMRIAHTPVLTAIPEPLYEFVYKYISQLWGNTAPLCRQHFATDPSIVSPVSVAVIFCHLAWSQFIPRLCLQAYAIWEHLLCHVKCYQKLPQNLANFKCDFLFSTTSCICVITWCIAVSVDLPGL
jgi:hypothetical protein